ncbi:putative transcription regulator Homeodomain-LIKE family [Helianthus annuus]|nr:putative transcription regulator Homeodomain-LIKE family [Helianthus annuus]
MDHNDDCNSDPSETYAYGLYGPFENLYRVGDEYQTNIPPLVTSTEYLGSIKNPFIEDEKPKAGSPFDFLIGLDIPVVWINQVKMEDNVDSTPDVSSEIKSVKINNFLVPGCVMESWSEMEKGSFVLGLYIFDKDFVRLKRFMESKKMGDVMSYYYGKFYRSDAYKQWSECRKSRGKRCVLGQRLFSGLRQQEFLCRLVPHVSQECQDSLMEVSRTFGDSKISLEQYVTSIKTLIGMKLFIDAVAIGKGKQDLTANAIEPTKQNQAIHIRPEIPTGKACSALTSTEIIKFLTGDYRLSKARSSDLFWEAVWPRLLARGWHSEQPNGYNYAVNGRHSLVFLMPGVKKFSRKLVKGEAYLDSVTDVLNKVASDPQLLELDNEQNGVSEMKIDEDEEEEEEEDEEEENEFFGKRKSHCYLQPRAPNLNHGNVLMKFTVVDTSLRCGKIFRVRELDAMKLGLRSRSDEIRSELVSSDDSDGENLFLVDRETKANGQKPAKKQKTSGELKNLEKRHVKIVNGLDSVTTKAKMSRKSNQENAVHHAKRRRRLTACIRVDSKAGSSLDSHVGSSSQANNNNHKLSSNLSFTSRCSSIDTEEQNQPQSMNLIDLNYPHVNSEFENGEFVTEVKDERNEPGPQKQSETIVGPREQENGGSRRQGTRNRPPTARALEAFANGFLTINSRKKSREEMKSRSFKHTVGEVGVISECSTGDASSAVKGYDENGEVEK